MGRAGKSGKLDPTDLTDPTDLLIAQAIKEREIGIGRGGEGVVRAAGGG